MAKHDSVTPEVVAKATAVWPSTLRNIFDVLCALYKRRGQTAAQGAIEATTVVLELSNYFGGNLYYIPRGDTLKRALRDLEIYSRVGKEKPRDLAQEYGLSLTHVYTIVAQQRALGKSKRAAPARPKP